ncbi:MAG: SDR family oxidoreductase, partial [Halobacteriovoraceae bacterium]|nr:SDR family oxidoreductase [Halobacteriovoraceae bacterium]
KKQVELENISTEMYYPWEIDMSSSQNIDLTILDIIKKFNQIDVLVNNAGTTVEKPFLSLEDDELDMIYNANMLSLAKISRRVLKEMLIAKSGNIVNVSSIVSKRWGRGVSFYASMKAGVNRLTQVLALEMGKKNIRINAVCPGVIETKLSGALQVRHNKSLLKETPLKRFGTPSDVSNAIMFLASDAVSSFTTGVTLDIDGGIGL